MNSIYEIPRVRPWIGCTVSMTIRFAFSAGLLCAVFGATAALNDTGVTQCGDATGYATNLCTGDFGTYPRQDGDVGRDALAAASQLTKTGAGSKGFDFNKIANNGSVLLDTATLGANPTDWACTRDNVTGLIWEVKTASADLRNQSHTYTWYQSNATALGASLGVVSGGACFTAGQCDTEKYVASVNAARLCGAADWRLPTYVELQSIVDYGSFNPAIDVNYFPNSPGVSYWWSSNMNITTTGATWAVGVYEGAAYSMTHSSAYSVRLVRTGP